MTLARVLCTLLRRHLDVTKTGPGWIRRECYLCGRVRGPGWVFRIRRTTAVVHPLRRVA